jgi:small subunit ribosomal protein S5
MTEDNKKNFTKREFGKNRRQVFRDKPVSEFDSQVLDIARVTRVTKGGKQLRFRAVVVIGNKKGKIGVGSAKGADVQQAVEKATRLAKKHLIIVPIFENSIPHEVEAKSGPARVLLRPQAKGMGLVAGGVVRVICSLSGIKDISSKLISRSRNKLNIAQATISALKKLKTENK